MHKRSWQVKSTERGDNNLIWFVHKNVPLLQELSSAWLEKVSENSPTHIYLLVAPAVCHASAGKLYYFLSKKPEAASAEAAGFSPVFLSCLAVVLTALHQGLLLLKILKNLDQSRSSAAVNICHVWTGSAVNNCWYLNAPSRRVHNVWLDVCFWCVFCSFVCLWNLQAQKGKTNSCDMISGSDIFNSLVVTLTLVKINSIIFKISDQWGEVVGSTLFESTCESSVNHLWRIIWI